MQNESTPPPELPPGYAAESRVLKVDGHPETVFDAKLQEVTNLRLAEEKLRQELLDLRRPYLFRNPQLLTALITSVGALIGVFLLVEDNYFKIREQRNAFQQEQTLRLDVEARDAAEKAQQAKREADTVNTAAESTKADAAKTVHDADLKIADANASLEKAESRLTSLKDEVAVRQLANNAEELVAAGNGDAARRAALRAWGLAETAESRQAVVHSFSLPLATLGKAGLFHKNFSFSPHSDRIIIAGTGGATIWNTTSGKEMFRIEPNSHLESAVYSPDASRVVTGDEEGKLVVWGASDGKPLVSIQTDHASVKNLRYSADGKRLITTDFENNTSLWNAENGKQLGHIEAQAKLLQITDYSPDGERVLTRVPTIAAKLKVTTITKLWDATTGKQISQLDGSVIALSSDMRHVLVDPYKPVIKDLATGKVIATIELQQGMLNSASFAPDGQMIVGIGNSVGLCVWNALTGKQVVTVSSLAEVPTSAGYSPDGTRLITEREHTVRILDTSTWKQLTQYEFEGLVATTELSTDNKSLVIQSTFGNDSTLLYKVVSADDVKRFFPAVRTRVP